MEKKIVVRCFGNVYLGRLMMSNRKIIADFGKSHRFGVEHVSKGFVFACFRQDTFD